MPTNYIKVSSDWKTISQFWIKVSTTWKSVSQGWIKVAGVWKQFFGSDNTYTFSFGNTVHIETNGYISLDSGQSAISIASTTGRVLGILPADLELNSIRYAADSSNFYVFFRGKRLGQTNFEIEYEVHFTNGQDYALIKLVAFPSSTYSLTGYYVDGSSTGYSRITATRTVGAEYRVYFGTTSAFATSFTDYGTASHPVWLAQSTLTSGSADDGYITVVGNQGSSAQAPSSVTASSITGTTATVSWSAITNANAGMSAIQSYDYSINGGGSWTSTGINTSANITGLSSNTSYTVLVRANNYFFTGVNYGSVTFSTLSNLTAPTITSVSSGVEYGPVSVFFTGGSGPFYQLYWTTGLPDTTPPVSFDASSSSSPLTDNTGPGPTGFTWYAYVRSVASSGETSVGPSTLASDWSAGFAFTVTAGNATAPTSVSAFTLSSSSIFVSWSGATNATQYRIWWSTSSTGNGVDPAVSFDAQTSSTSFTFTGLNASTTYYFWVSAAGANNVWTSYSSSPRGQATTSAPPAPSTPGTPTLTYLSSGSTVWFYSASWGASSGSGTIVYQILGSGSSGGSNFRPNSAPFFSTNSANFSLPQSGGTFWTVQVRASNDNGVTWSNFSASSNSA